MVASNYRTSRAGRRPACRAVHSAFRQACGGTVRTLHRQQLPLTSFHEACTGAVSTGHRQQPGSPSTAYREHGGEEEDEEACS
jgi:hypothetical protein